MKLCWHGEARAEANAAASFYDDKQPGLAQRFLDNLPGRELSPLSDLDELSRGKSRPRPRDDRRLYVGPYLFVQARVAPEHRPRCY